MTNLAWNRAIRSVSVLTCSAKQRRMQPNGAMLAERAGFAPVLHSDVTDISGVTLSTRNEFYRKFCLRNNVLHMSNFVRCGANSICPSLSPVLCLRKVHASPKLDCLEVLFSTVDGRTAPSAHAESAVLMLNVIHACG